MEVDAGRMKGNFATGAIDEMTDGVKIRLLKSAVASKRAAPVQHSKEETGEKAD